MKVIKQCNYCGERFEVKVLKEGDKTPNYCSRRCAEKKIEDIVLEDESLER